MDPIQKLSPTPPNSCCRLNSFKRVGVLLAFHSANIFVAIGGLLSVALLLASMVLMPVWFVALLLVVIAMSAVHGVQQISNKYLMYFGYVVLAAIYIASLSVNWYITVGPYAILAVGAVGIGFFFLSALTMKFLMKIDVHLANFVHSPKANGELEPDECMDRFKLSETSDSSFLLPHIRMTGRVWLGVIYFALHKLLVGGLSLAVLIITVLLPALVIFSGGDVSFFGNQATLGNNPVVYIVLIVSIWLVGAVGMPVVAVRSVKLTWWVCGESKSEQDQTTFLQTQGDVIIPITPEPTASTTNFEALDSKPAVV
ncbi:hypothetical protein PHMEG_0005480 [Phytophthora megakarya]|uniref:Uncharacterized protein n=1 Tax=Phytophthora megakarya TaxID=4795 RepID=A0A225WR68_9STRA|nr:hypothetical protein PHMEG_0005480 [Phytophthora megakarya]